MKKYLFGLGAMIVGAGLMFVLMYGEVSAEGESDRYDFLEIPNDPTVVSNTTYLRYCKVRDLTCVVGSASGIGPISCVKTKGGIFK